MGRIIDDGYHEKSGYVKKLREFWEKDVIKIVFDHQRSLVKDVVVPWTQVFDKGYYPVQFNWEEGKQRTVQPVCLWMKWSYI